MLLLPVSAVVLLTFVLYLWMKKKEISAGWMHALLYSLSLNTLILLMANEILSVFHAINRMSLVLLWTLIDVIAFAVLIMYLCWNRLVIRGILKSEIQRGKNFLKYPLHWILILICSMAVYMAVRIVPHNWDSMTYHLTRIIHWVQNGSIGHYACHDVSQIAASPLAEFVNLHVFILAGYEDYFVNLLQTFSFIISVMLVYRISGRIGCNRMFCSLACILFATSPIVFAEALSTQVDLYSGLWLLSFVYSILDFTDKNRKLVWNQQTRWQLFFLGLSAAFCYLSKISVCIAALVFIIYLLMICVLRKDELKTVVKSIVLVGGVALGTAMPEMLRNLITFQALSDPETSTGFLVSSWDIRYLLANLIQNIGYHLSSVFMDIVDFVDKVIYKIIYVLYTGQEVPQSLLGFRIGKAAAMKEDSAINPPLTWLFIFGIVIFCVMLIVDRWKKRYSHHLKDTEWDWGYIWAANGSFLLFCMIVSWYKFVTRYEVGYYALLAPAIMLIFQYILRFRKQLSYALAGCLLYVSMVYCVNLHDIYSYYYGPLSGEERIMQYFTVRGGYDNYRAIANQVNEKEFSKIGFVCGFDSYEYPLWRMLEDGSMTRLEHIAVENGTGRYSDEQFIPDCIIVVDVPSEDTIEYKGREYKLVCEKENISLFE